MLVKISLVKVSYCIIGKTSKPCQGMEHRVACSAAPLGPGADTSGVPRADSRYSTERPGALRASWSGEVALLQWRGATWTYLIQVQLVALFEAWPVEEAGVQVTPALEGKALLVLTDL